MGAVLVGNEPILRSSGGVWCGRRQLSLALKEFRNSVWVSLESWSSNLGWSMPFRRAFENLSLNMLASAAEVRCLYLGR